MANKFVKEFQFPASAGFTGSAGKVPVRPHMRKAAGGPVHGDVSMDRKEISTAVHKHEKRLHPGKKLTKLK